MPPDKVQKTVITTLFRLFKFPLVSFALRNAAQTFKPLMDEFLREFDTRFDYIDDILVYSQTPEKSE